MSISFGYDVKGEDDVYVTKTEALTEAVVDIISPTSSIVNVFPFRKPLRANFFKVACDADVFTVRHLPTWVPGMGKVRHVDTIRRLSRETQDEPFNFVRDSIVSGIPILMGRMCNLFLHWLTHLL